MGRFLCILAVTFCLGIGAAWYWTVNDLIKFSNPDYALWLARKLMLDNCAVGTLAVIGDSQAETSIVPKKIGPGVVNFGLTGSSFITALAVSRRIVACPIPPKAVVISVNPKEFIEADRFWDKEVKFGIFDLDLDKIRRRARAWEDTSLYDKPVPFDIDARLKNTLFQAKIPAYYFSSLVAGYVYRREKANMGFLRDTIKDRGYHYLGESIGDEAIDPFFYRKHFEVSGFFETYFGEILDLYAMHHIPVYFISAPFKSTAVNVMKPEFKRDYLTYVEQWEHAYPNFHILGALIPSLPPEDFSDEIHLNAMGAAIWSSRVADLLNAAKVDTGSFVVPD